VSLIKADGNVIAFVSRPIAATLALITAVMRLSPLLTRRRASANTA